MSDCRKREQKIPSHYKGAIFNLLMSIRQSFRKTISRYVVELPSLKILYQPEPSEASSTVLQARQDDYQGDLAKLSTVTWNRLSDSADVANTDSVHEAGGWWCSTWPRTSSISWIATKESYTRSEFGSAKGNHVLTAWSQKCTETRIQLDTYRM